MSMRLHARNVAIKEDAIVAANFIFRWLTVHQNVISAPVSFRSGSALGVAAKLLDLLVKALLDSPKKLRRRFRVRE